MFPTDNLNLTIDTIYTELLERLTHECKIIQVSKYLSSETEYDKKVLYIYDIIRNYGLIPLVIKVNKCELVSAHYRNLGNQHYQQQNNYIAWQYYNLALMYAPLQANSYTLAISNRSAVFAALKKYDACLEDIEMVFNLPHPETLRDKLIKRKNKCQEALQEEQPDKDKEEEDKLAEEILTYKGPKNERYLSASTKLQVKYSQESGRHVVAKDSIEVGEVIVQEEPFAKVLLKSQYVFTCAYCLSRKLNLYPCPFCCLTMYCSRPCVERAWNEYHRFECPLIAGLVKMNFTKLELLALRTTIKARSDYPDWNKAMTAASGAESTVYTNHWGHVKFGGKYVYESTYYPSIHTLATNIDKRDVSDIFQKTVSAAILLHCLGVSNFGKINDTELKVQMRSFIAKTLLTHLMTAPTNMHGIATNVENEEGNFVEEYNIASAPYAFLSLINHSCAPNVVRYSRLGSAKMSLIAIRPISKGQEILDNYGYDEVIRDEEDTLSLYALPCEPGADGVSAALAAPGRPKKKVHHAVHTREERQAILKSQYKFTCLCEACVENWPLYNNLNTITDLPPRSMAQLHECLHGDAIEMLQKGDRNVALKAYNALCELATTLDPYIPCKEAAECQEALKQCLAIIAGVLPKGYAKIVDWEIPPPYVPGMPDSSRFYTGHGAIELIS